MITTLIQRGHSTPWPVAPHIGHTGGVHGAGQGQSWEWGRSAEQRPRWPAKAGVRLMSEEFIRRFMQRVVRVQILQCPACGHWRLVVMQVLAGVRQRPVSSEAVCGPSTCHTNKLL